MKSKRIAILGATSQIARDLIAICRTLGWTGLHLFARRPIDVEAWQRKGSVELTSYPVSGFETFPQHKFDAILNFVGVGNPAQAIAMGASIFDVTSQFDQMAIDYVRKNPTCRYIFLSSGAAFGSDFRQPVDENSIAKVPANHLKPHDWYGVAKLHAECRHRALAEVPIVDVRIFNYFSRTQDLSARFLITDMLRAIRDGDVLSTNSQYIVRDYLHPSDFYGLLEALLTSPPTNTAVDCYSKSPVDKPTLLEAMRLKFGLEYQLTDGGTSGVNATGEKAHYYSKNRRAADFGYVPKLTSLEGIMLEAEALIKGSSALHIK